MALTRNGSVCVLLLAIMLSQVVIFSTGAGLTTTTVTVNNTSLNVTTAPPPTCPPDYTDCRCVFTREPAKYYYDTGFLPHQRSVWREFIAALYGFPFGVALSVATFFLYHYYCKSKESKYRKPTAKRDCRSNIKGRINPFHNPAGKLKNK